MSNFDESDEKRIEGTLVVEAPPGVEVQIVDARFRSFYIGGAPVTLQLQAGLYTVIWQAGGRSEEQLVRVRGERINTVKGGNFPLGSASPSLSPTASELERDQFLATVRLAEIPPDPGSTEIMVIIRSGNERPTSDIGKSIQLLDDAGHELKPLGGEEQQLSEEVRQFAVRRYRVEPGMFAVKYLSSGRRLLEQGVAAFVGRRTLIFLKYGTAVLPSKRGDAVRYAPQRGIDPAQTTIISIASGGVVPDLDQQIRQAEILLHKLEAAENLFDPDLLAGLQQPDADPYLRLYAAALLIGAPVAVEGTRDPVPSQLKTVANLIGTLDESLPDIYCIRWQLHALDPQFPDAHGVLSAPPILDLCWRWAAALSISEPGRLDGVAALVSNDLMPSGAWCTRKPNRSDIHKLAAPELTQSITEIGDQVRNLVAVLSELADERPSFDAMLHLPVPDLAISLSPATVQFANAAMSSVSGIKTGSMSPQGNDSESLARSMAFLTRTAGPDLSAHLKQAFSEVNAFKASLTGRF